MVMRLLALGGPIYSACWSPDADQVLYANGKGLVIKPLQSGLKPMQWTAHDGIILCTDWSSANNLIVSGGEDRKYKVSQSVSEPVSESVSQSVNESVSVSVSESVS